MKREWIGWHGPAPRPIIPYEEDMIGWSYTVGLFNGEGTAYTEKKRGRFPAPVICIKVCARDSLEIPARLWNVSIVREVKGLCKRPSENPEGRPSKVRKVGRGAYLVYQEMLKTGKLSAEKNAQLCSACRFY
jgi:hypothetical protein